MLGFELRRVACALLLLLSAGGAAADDDDIIGCGGFLRAEGKMDLSGVKARLVTRSGLVKSDTECAPNGYYYLPLYDKGEYLIQLLPPAGWLLEPQHHVVSSNPDGPCAQGKDLDFKIIGFAIAGKVTTEGSDVGPQGVELTLQDKSGKKYTTTSEAGGGYTFKDAPAGEYKLTVSHPTFKFRTQSTQVKASFMESEIKETFGVLGYDLSGQVEWQGGEGSGSVAVMLMGKGSGAKPESLTCKLSDTAKAAGAWCSAVTDASGKYVFPSVPIGSYEVTPDFKDPAVSKFEIEPKKVSATVEHGPAEVTDKMLLLAFTVSGRVLDTAGAGVEGADILVGGKKQAVTDAKGNYNLKVKVGTYTIEAKKEHMTFATLKDYQVSSQLRRIGSITAEAYSICGEVVMESASAEGRAISAMLKGKTVSNTKTDSKGKFCFMLEPGTYTLSIASDPSVLIAPSKIEVSNAKGPTLDARFAQATLHVRGKVKCLDTPCDKSVKVTLLEGTSVVREAKLGKKGSFAIDDVSPGKYKVMVEKDGWCWKSDSRKVEVGAEDTMAVNFEQTGFKKEAKVPQALTLKLKDSKGKEHPLSLSSGQSEFCVPASDTFEIASPECIKLAQASFDSDSTTVDFTPSRHAVVLRLSAASSAEGLSLGLKVNGKDVSIDDLTSKGQGIYETTYWASVGDELSAKPSAEKGDLLFVPESSSLKVTGPTGCPSAAMQFKAKKGLMLKGKVLPELGGVVIKAIRKSGEVIASVETQADGSYSIGPLGEEKEYTLEATKEGYNFKEEGQGNFRSVRMGILKISVTDKDGTVLSGALMSLSGESGFRQNNKTGTDGQLTYSALVPGSYFLRPIMKEYEFKPNSQSITVNEGTNDPVNLVGKRVAFSAHGVVKMLDGHPEKNAVVQAIDADGSSVEETATDNDGVFRVRGLKPGEKYKLNVKTEAGSKHERCSPSEIELVMGKQDSKGHEFLVFRRPSKLSLVGRVNASIDQLSSIKVEVSTASNPSNILQSTSLMVGDYFEFPAMSRDTYILKASASLDSRAYKFTTSQTKVVLEDGYEAVILPFNAEPRNSGEAVPTTSFYVLVLIVAGAMAAFNRKDIISSLKGQGAKAPGPDAHLSGYLPNQLKNMQPAKKKA